MDDMAFCPICGNKLKTNHHNNRFLYVVKKIADYAERICSNGHNHLISFWVDKETKQVDFIKVSLGYSTFLEIDYVNNQSRIKCTKNGETEYIKLPKIVELDFPNLDSVKEKISLYVTFS